MTSRYPPARWLGNGIPAGAYIGAPFRLLWHTTETTGLPDYTDKAGRKGGSAPHLTYDPKTRRWYQHTDLTRPARALRNMAGGVETNRANCIQVEIICYSAKNVADGSTARLWVGHLPDSAYADLRAFAVWTFAEFGVKDYWPGKQALSYAQANAPGFRMTSAEWLAFNGQCGHQHATENAHWDPGAIDWTRLVIEDDEVSMSLPINAASGKEDIRLIQGRLQITEDGVWGPNTTAAVKQLGERSRTGDPDGLNGSHVNAKMYNELTEEYIKRFAGPGGGLTVEDVKTLIRQSRIEPPE